ncbi:MAG: hypothetical protein PHG85_07135, partial [Candidatus Altiarchaeota archaeon]|nr:hypothetical protein [Candidatus Altiarchaeota archaeon]
MKGASMKISSRAQGAVEFLMTYGWALVIVLIVGVVAWKWGVFNFTGTIQPGSYGFWGVTPIDYKMGGSGILTLSIENGVGVNVTINSVKAISDFNATVIAVGVVEPGKRVPVD